MAVQITIIGLGQTGASIGLALAAHKEKVFTIGHDKDYGVEQRAKKINAVEEVSHNLPTAVGNADLVILAIPVHQLRDTLNYIAEDLKKDSVIVELTPVKKEVSKWMKELLPEHCHYVGLVPAIGPSYIDKTETGLDSAKPDMFSKSTFLLSAHPGTPGEAVKLVSDFVRLLDATAIFTDFVESDGLMASAYLLPQLVSTSFLNATINQPGWEDVRKVASHAYFAASSAFSEGDDVDTLSTLSFQNRENVLRALDKMIHAMLNLRDELENQEEDSFKKHLQSAQQGRTNWMNDRAKGDWLALQNEPVEKISIMENLLGSTLGKRFKPKE
jgi:prephenate dehydrogenase